METVAAAQRSYRRSVGVKHQRGQSLVESAIACVVVVPLFVGVYLLGQYMHVRQVTQQSARAAAWDAAVSSNVYATSGSLPAQNLAQDRMRALQFGALDTKVAGAAAPSRLTDPMLTTFAGRDLVLTNNVLLRTYTNAKSPALTEKVLGAITTATKSIGLGAFPPDPDGLLTAEVHVKPEHVTSRNGQAMSFMAPLDTLDLDFHGRTVLLADAWNAQGSGENDDGNPASGASPRSVRMSIRPLVISEYGGSSADKLLDAPFHLIGSIPFANKIWTNNMKKIEFGKAGPDVVPTDRLAAYGNAR